jgi:SAM-dependent methyltransferase
VSEGEDVLEESLAGIAELYAEGLRHHGPLSQSVGWKDEESQRLRFAKLALVLAGDAAPVLSVNDWGCGYGAMFQYLAAVLGERLESYTGYDISEEMVSAARGFVHDPRASFVHGSDELRRADYSFVSGTFNVKLGAPDDVWRDHVEATLLRLAGVSRRGLAFNLLTSYVDWREDHLYYADPAYFFRFCREGLGRYVTLVHDYPLYEWTMLVQKEDRPS